jgi:hypothetical protein
MLGALETLCMDPAACPVLRPLLRAECRTAKRSTCAIHVHVTLLTAAAQYDRVSVWITLAGTAVCCVMRVVTSAQH